MNTRAASSNFSFLIGFVFTVWGTTGPALAQPAKTIDDIASAIEGDVQTVEGVVVANQRVNIRNNTDENVNILWLVKEGTQVKKGDLLVTLDSSGIEDKLTKVKVVVTVRSAELQKAKAKLARATLAAKTQKLETQAQLALLASQEKMLFSKTGQFTVDQQSLESTISTETARLRLLQKQMATYKQEGKQQELAVAETEFHLVESENKLRVAKANLSHLMDNLKNHEKQKLELERQVVESQGIRLSQEAEAGITDAKANVVALEHELKMEQSRLDSFKRKIKQCDIKAPSAGTVFYSNFPSRNQDVVMEAGALIRPRQSIVYLPNLETLDIECQVPESMIEKVKAGQFVTFNSESREAKGKVIAVANFPSVTWGSRTVRTYRVKIRPVNQKGIKIGQRIKVQLSDN